MRTVFSILYLHVQQECPKAINFAAHSSHKRCPQGMHAVFGVASRHMGHNTGGERISTACFTGDALRLGGDAGDRGVSTLCVVDRLDGLDRVDGLDRLDRLENDSGDSL